MDTRKLLAKVSENWPAKVLSIGMALLLFVFHKMTNIEERFFSAPLKVEVDSTIIAASSYPRMVRLSVRGDASKIRSLLEEDIIPYIDLKGKDRGIYRVPVQFYRYRTALGIEPLEIRVNPLEISMTLDNRVSKSVPIRVNTRGPLKRGYELVDFTLMPPEVLIDGPADLMKDITEITTDFIELDGRSEDFSIMVSILNLDPLVVIRGNGMTEFKGFIREIIGLENFEDLPISVIGLNRRFIADVEIKSGNVRLEGSQQGLGNYKPPASFLSLDCSSITEPGSYTLPVAVKLDSAFILLRQEPEKVTVHIREKSDRDL